MKNKNEKRRGQALVEFALCLPILLLILFGILDFGRMFFIQHTMTLASQNAARAGIIPDATEGEADTIIDAKMSNMGLAQGDYNIAYTNFGVNGQTGQTVTVTVSHTYQALFPGFIPYLTNKQLTGTASMRHE